MSEPKRSMQAVLAGFGGQGILFAGKIIANAGLLEDRELSWLPSYGPEMRGGTANCSVCLSDDPIGSPLVLNPDVLVVMNQPSLDKFEHSVQPGGLVIVDSTLVPRIPDMPGVTVCAVPATALAEEAGLKSVTFEVNAPYAFGRLSVEAGTHRLVRISPFDNQGRRQTSFAAVEVIPLIEQTDAIEIPESEIKVDVFRSSGPGGQSVNTTDSAVRLTHLPTGIVVSMQNEKSQLQNRAAALRVLQSRLLLLRKEQEDAKKKELAGDIKASWGDQMRSYVLHPYQMVKDLRTGYEEGNTSNVLDGGLNAFIDAGIRWRASGRAAEDS